MDFNYLIRKKYYICELQKASRKQHMKQYKKVLTIAGSDSGGGAGIQADIKAISACGCYAESVITAITAQNTSTVKSILPIPPQIVADQIECVLSDIGADAIKTGMLLSKEIMEVIHTYFSKHRYQNIVVDPVMISTSGKPLITEVAIDYMKSNILPLARIITPNIPEAEVLLDGEKIGMNDMEVAAKKIAKRYNVSVLLKAGHIDNDYITDFFYNNETDETHTLDSKKTKTKNTHGTGCTMSSALASMLALGHTPDEAFRLSHQYIKAAIEAGADYEIGHGHGPVHHFFNLWKETP